jgi:hypothetical protein
MYIVWVTSESSGGPRRRCRPSESTKGGANNQLKDNHTLGMV